MNTFEDGIEAAVREIEATDCGLFGKELLTGLAQRVRALRETSNGSAVTLITGVDAAFERFKEEYPPTPGRSHWTPARKAFEKAIKRGYSAETIIQGTRAFAMSGKEKQYVEAPSVFLNQDRFLTEYAPSQSHLMGAAGLSVISAAMRSR